MTDKQKIVDILKAYTKKHNISASVVILEEYAEELLANGVIVPPVPICTTVYEIRAKGKGSPRGRYCNYSVTTNYSLRNAIERGLELYVKPKEFVKTDMTRWNKTVFLTKEDAMKKLKELGK